MKKKSIKLVASVFLAMTLSAATPGIGQTQKIEATTTRTTTEGTLTEFGPQGVVIETKAGEQPVLYISNETTNYVDEAGNPVEISTIKSGMPVQVFYTKVGDTLIASKVLVRNARVPARELTRVVVPGTTKVVPAPATIKRTEVTVSDPRERVVVPVGAPERAELPVVPARDRLDPGRGISTTTFGTVSGFGADSLIVQSESSPTPIPHFVSRKTTYVDESGAPIFADSIRKGTSVTVYSTREGERLVASRVIMKKAVVLEAAPTTIVNPPPVSPDPAVIEKKTTTTTTTRKKID